MREILIASADELTRRHGPGHWSKTVKIATLRNHAKCKLVFLVERAGVVVATFTLTDRRISFYRTAWFAEPDQPALYLTNVAVLPAHQGEGIGRWCLSRVDQVALEQGARAVRLDVYSGPAGAGVFYERSGYTFIRRGPHALDIYEKRLDS